MLCLGTAIAKRRVCMLYHPIRAFGSKALKESLIEVFGYIFGPEKWLAKMTFISMRVKPVIYRVQIWVAFIFDVALACGLCYNLFVWPAPWQVNTCYAYSAISAVFFAVASLTTTFFDECKDGEFQAYVDDYRIRTSILHEL